MKNQKTLIALVVVLVLLNLATLSFFWFTKHDDRSDRGRNKPPRVENFLAKKLELSESQKEEFKKARKQHFRQTRELMKGIHQNRKQLNSLLGEEGDQMQVQLLADIAEKRGQLEKLNFEHLKNLRSLCNDNQKQKFDQVVSRMTEKGFGRRGPQPRRMDQ